MNYLSRIKFVLLFLGGISLSHIAIAAESASIMMLEPGVSINQLSTIPLNRQTNDVNYIDLTPDQALRIGCTEQNFYESSNYYIPSYTQLVNCSESTLQTDLLLKNRDLINQQHLDEERASYQNIADHGLALFVHKNPQLKYRLESAPGYAIFEIKNYTALLYVAAYGKGIIFDNVNARKSYIYTVRSGTGIGLGFQDVYALVIFKSHVALEQFDSSKSVGGDIGASATLGIWGGQISFNPYIEFYLINELGFNLQANWGGTLYFATPGLNE